jgi:hypothetical protein
MSARAAAQLEFLGFEQLYHYMRGKADWIVRGLPTEPRAPLGERLRALPYFINNLAPGFRAAWIRFSGRITVGDSTRDDLIRLSPEDALTTVLTTPKSAVSVEISVSPNAAVPSKPPETGRPLAVVLNAAGTLLGAVETAAPRQPASEAMNPGPQTIRPDMTLGLAATLLRDNPYILVTSARGRYIGRYHPPVSQSAVRATDRKPD